MGFFKKEVVIYKESNEAKAQLEQLEALLPQATGTVAQRIQQDIAMVKAGIAGEENILFELKNSGMDMVVLQDVYLEYEDLSAQIDFFVITPKMNFLLECKNLIGNIEINNNGDFIRTFEYGGRKVKEGLYSPITQNERHMQVWKNCNLRDAGTVQKLLMKAGFDNFNKSLVVLANPKTVLNDRFAKKEVKAKVLRADQLIATIKKMNDESDAASISMKGMLESAEYIKRLHVEQRTDYTKKYMDLIAEEEAKQENASTASGEKVCPRCGGKLVLRTARNGAYAGNQFYGCSNYPRCKFIENV